MKNTNRLFFAILGLIFLACSNKEDNQFIESELQEYFDLFVQEAQQNGLSLDLSQLDIGGYIQEIERRGTIGQCFTYSDGSQAIVVDRANWFRIDELQKEYVVFHELGHCILQRSHSDSYDAQGACVSIMQSGAGSCKQLYTLENREQLLKELFSN